MTLSFVWVSIAISLQPVKTHKARHCFGCARALKSYIGEALVDWSDVWYESFLTNVALNANYV